VLISFIKGAAPIQALEFGRRAIPAHVRPDFNDMEKSCKGGGNSAAAGA
jgi:chemotaxis protein MotA